MPKQAHMADLQARAAAANLLAELNGKPATQTFKVELMCIIDSGNRGMLLTRTATGGTMLPPTALGHWAERLFERWYLRQYR